MFFKHNVLRSGGVLSSSITEESSLLGWAVCKKLFRSLESSDDGTDQVSETLHFKTVQEGGKCHKEESCSVKENRQKEILMKSECCSSVDKQETECGSHAKYIHDSVRNCVIETCTCAGSCLC